LPAIAEALGQLRPAHLPVVRAREQIADNANFIGGEPLIVEERVADRGEVGRMLAADDHPRAREFSSDIDARLLLPFVVVFLEGRGRYWTRFSLIEVKHDGVADHG